MDSLVIEPTITAQWLALVQDATEKSAHQLEHELEHYLVNVLIRSTNRPEVCTQALATHYLEAASLQPNQKALKYQDIGDQCLLITGLWPERAHKRLVDTPYYVKLGRSSYWLAGQSISKATGHLYRRVCESFIALMDILSAMRDMMQPNICLLTELDKWQKLGSEHAHKKLADHDPKLLKSLEFFGQMDSKAAH